MVVLDPDGDGGVYIFYALSLTVCKTYDLGHSKDRPDAFKCIPSMRHNNHRQVTSRLLERAYLEIIPTGTIMDRLVHIPPHRYVGITCSPTKGLEPTLELVEKLRALPAERQLKLIPHVAARMIRDKGHLREILARLEAARVESIFVPGGDAAVPVGQHEHR